MRGPPLRGRSSVPPRCPLKHQYQSRTGGGREALTVEVVAMFGAMHVSDLRRRQGARSSAPTHLVAPAPSGAP